VSGAVTDQLEAWELQRVLAVLRVVSRRTQVAVPDILGKSRLAERVQARRLAVFALRHHVGLGWRMLGRIVGHRAETVLDSVRLLENRARVDPATREELSGLLEELKS